MKKIYLAILALPTLSLAQTVQTVNVTTKEIAYSVFNSKIYATIPSANGANGNSIGRINPLTATLENTVAIGSEPGPIAMSSDGTTLYCGFSGTSSVRRFSVVNNAAGIQFPLGTDSSTGNYFAEDVEVMPGNPDVIAVSRRNIGYSPKHEGVAIYENGIMRPTTTPDHTGSNQIEFTGESSLVGFNNESTEFGFRRMSVNASGVSVVSVTQSLVYDWSAKFSVYGTKAFFNSGIVVDFGFAPFVSGTFPAVNGPGVYDPYSNLVCFASSNGGAITFKRFNPETYLLVDSLPITQAFGEAMSIVACGNGRYAFNTTDNKVVIIGGMLSAPEANVKNIVLYPNPAKDRLEISGLAESSSIKVLNAIGQVVMQQNAETSDNTILNVAHLTNGAYFVEIQNSQGKLVKRFIKS